VNFLPTNLKFTKTREKTVGWNNLYGFGAIFTLKFMFANFFKIYYRIQKVHGDGMHFTFHFTAFLIFVLTPLTTTLIAFIAVG
jgi:hypothetical protein